MAKSTLCLDKKVMQIQRATAQSRQSLGCPHTKYGRLRPKFSPEVAAHICLFVYVDANNFSVIYERFPVWVEPVLCTGSSVLLKDMVGLKLATLQSQV